MAVEDDVFPQDIIQQILIRGDAKDLVRFKSVCKSWQSLISEDFFVKAHLKHSSNNDRNNQKKGHRRIVLSRDSMPYNVQRYYWHNYGCNLVGSSNGLVCIYTSHGEVIVANPLTRDTKKLPNPKNWVGLEWTTCWGFGYDSSTDDYKVIVGSSSGCTWTRFQVLSLKTNVWKDVGKLDYMIYSLYNVGILCNGKLHWFQDQNRKAVILSFDLSEEKFEEICQPRDFKCKTLFHLGIIEECLCICDNLHRLRWVMKNHNVRESWVSFQYTREIDNDVVHYLRPIKDSLSHTSFFTNEDLIIRSWRTGDADHLPIFVRSLVSPHVNGKLKRKTEAKSTDKLFEGDHTVT